jgi:hypothetical protein
MAGNNNKNINDFGQQPSTLPLIGMPPKGVEVCHTSYIVSGASMPLCPIAAVI